MSIAVMTDVWRRSQHSGSHLLMMLALADFSDDDGNCYPAVTTLAEKCRMKPRNANLVLAALRDSGELQIRLNEGPKGTNRYRIVLAALGGLQRATGMQNLAGMQAAAGAQGAAGVQPATATPVAGCSKPLQPATDEPSLNRQEPSKRERARKKPETAIPEGFSISERVRTWASEKGFTDLEIHLENFIGKAKAKGYTYLDWDEALMNAIRGDWAGLRSSTRTGRDASTTQNASFRSTDYAQEA